MKLLSCAAVTVADSCLRPQPLLSHEYLASKANMAVDESPADRERRQRVRTTSHAWPTPPLRFVLAQREWHARACTLVASGQLASTIRARCDAWAGVRGLARVGWRAWVGALHARTIGLELAPFAKRLSTDGDRHLAVEAERDLVQLV